MACIKVGLDSHSSIGVSMDNLHSLIDQNETTDVGLSVSGRTQKNISDFKQRLTGIRSIQRVSYDHWYLHKSNLVIKV